jgi:hypothetical protein
VNRELVSERFAEEKRAPNFVEDLEKSLKFAEELQEKIAETDSKVFSSRMKEVMAVFFGLFIPMIPRLLIDYDSTLAKKVLFAGLLLTSAASLYAVLMEFRNINLTRRAKSDKRRLEDLLGLIHETERAISNSHELSTLTREYLRIRISRFGIGSNAWKR